MFTRDQNKNQGLILGIGNSVIFSSFIIISTLILGIIIGAITQKFIKKRNENFILPIM